MILYTYLYKIIIHIFILYILYYTYLYYTYYIYIRYIIHIYIRYKIRYYTSLHHIIPIIQHFIKYNNTHV